MNAKVMKEFVEGKSELTAEYAFASVSSNSAYLDFSDKPKFVSISLFASKSKNAYTINVPYSQTQVAAWYTSGSGVQYCTVSFTGNSVHLELRTAVEYVEGIAFF